MKPNSCLFRAVSQLVKHQFGVPNPSSDIFDKYNTGDGINIDICVPIINESLEKYGIRVKAVYCHYDEPSRFSSPEVLRPPQFVPSPCIVITDSHAEALIATNTQVDGIAAIVLAKI